MTDFTVDAPATVGDVQSWSVSEAATQVSPVESVRSTPSFSAVVKTTADTKFATHAGAALTRAGLGTIEGYARSISAHPLGSSLDCQTVLNQLNVDAEFSETFFPEGLLSDYVKALVGHAVTNPPTPPPDPSAGKVWRSGAAPYSGWSDVAYGNGVFVAVASNSSPVVMTSPDGVTWTTRTAPIAYWRGVTYANGMFVAVASGGTYPVMTSPDGVTWTGRTAPLSGWWHVIYGAGLFVAVSLGGTYPVMTSPDGITWTARTAPAASWEDVTYGAGLFVAVTDGGATYRVMTSPDGITWTGRVVPNISWISVAYGAGLFVAVAIDGTNPIMTSPDGITWTGHASPATGWHGITYGNDLFVAVSGGPVAASSPDGVTWTTSIVPNELWQAVTYGSGMFVAVAASATVTVVSGSFPLVTIWRATADPTVAYIPWRGNIWQILNALLALNGVELVYSNSQLVIRDVGSVVMELDNTTVIERSITAVDARQSVNVAYREAYAQTGTIYDAYVDGNKAYSIGVNEYREDKIVYEVPLQQWSLELNAMRQIGTITNVPTRLDQPTEANTGTVKPVAGQFVISDKDGTPLPKGMFFGYGGKLAVALNPGDPFSFYLTWRGPSTEIPDHPGPYSLQVGERGCFTVTGDATFAVSKTVNVKTGADPSKVTDATPLEIDWPFVNSNYQAFGVGAAAGVDLCSTVEELSFSIATNKLEGFGLTPGSIFRYDNAFWRIVTVGIGNTITQITARYHTTFANVDTEWAGGTYDQFDALWAAHPYKDFKIEPLRTH